MLLIILYYYSSIWTQADFLLLLVDFKPMENTHSHSCVLVCIYLCFSAFQWVWWASTQRWCNGLFNNWWFNKSERLGEQMKSMLLQEHVDMSKMRRGCIIMWNRNWTNPCSCKERQGTLIRLEMMWYHQFVCVPEDLDIRWPAETDSTAPR